MSKVKKIKIKQPDGSFSEYVDLGANATNVDMANGENLEDTVGKINENVKQLQEKVEEDPTVPNYVKEIKEDDINNWNSIYWKTID